MRCATRRQNGRRSAPSAPSPTWCAYYLVWQLKHGKDWERYQYRVIDLEGCSGLSAQPSGSHMPTTSGPPARRHRPPGGQGKPVSVPTSQPYDCSVKC